MNSSAPITHVSEQQHQQIQENTITNSGNLRNNLGSGFSQLVNRVDNIIQSNTFLRSDLGTLINTESNNSVMSSTNLPNQMQSYNRLNSAYQQHDPSQSHIIFPGGELAPNTEDQIVLNLQANGGNENGILNDQHQQQQPVNPEQAPNFVIFFFQALQSSLPFFIILVAKIFHQHLLGFFIVLGFVATLHWSNKTLVRQVELKVS